MNFTRRESHVFFVFVLLMIGSFLIPQRILDEWELPYLLLVVAPLGIYIATDPERRS